MFVFSECSHTLHQLQLGSYHRACNKGIRTLVMVSKNNGVTAKGGQSNNKLLNIHRVCHRLALACTDSCDQLKLIKEVDVLRQLWYYFHNSPKKTACFLKCQMQLKKVTLNHTDETKKLLAKRLKKACQTRWLSFNASVTAALQSYEAIPLMPQLLI